MERVADLVDLGAAGVLVCRPDPDLPRGAVVTDAEGVGGAARARDRDVGHVVVAVAVLLVVPPHPHDDVTEDAVALLAGREAPGDGLGRPSCCRRAGGRRRRRRSPCPRRPRHTHCPSGRRAAGRLPGGAPARRAAGRAARSIGSSRRARQTSRSSHRGASTSFVPSILTPDAVGVPRFRREGAVSCGRERGVSVVGWLRSSRGLPHGCPGAREGHDACRTPSCRSRSRSRPWRGRP